MDIRNFHGLRPGPADKGYGDLAMISVDDLGELQVASGKLAASNGDLARALTFSVPPGSYPVRATMADVSEEHDGSKPALAYLSVVFSEAPSLTVGPAHPDPQPDEDVAKVGSYWTVAAESTVAFADAVTHENATEASTSQTLVARDAGAYPVLETHDADGNLTGIHIDLLVVGPHQVDQLDEPADTSRDLDMTNFLALKTGQGPYGFDEQRMLNLRVMELGEIHVPSGNLAANDPFMNPIEYLVVTPVPPGSYPVRVTLADETEEQDGSYERPSYLSVILSEQDYVSVEPTPNWIGYAPPGEGFGIGVDAGTAGFVDADAMIASMPSDREARRAIQHGQPDSWDKQLFKKGPYRPQVANIVLPGAQHGENVVMTIAGFGDGMYPLLQTRAADGTVTAIHIEFDVSGWAGEELLLHWPSYPKRIDLEESRQKIAYVASLSN